MQRRGIRFDYVALVLLLGWVMLSCAPDSRMTAEAYRNLEVPEDRIASPAARSAGRLLFRQHCMICHGERADGHGARRSGLSTAPRDYTDPVWRQRTSPRDVFVAIKEGVPTTAMPAWSHFSDGECWDLAAYVLSVAEHGP